MSTCRHLTGPERLGDVLGEQEDRYSCAACSRSFPEVRGVVRFVEENNYADSFGNNARNSSARKWTIRDGTFLNWTSSERPGCNHSISRACRRTCYTVSFGKPGLGSRVSGEHSFQSGRVNPGYARLAEQVSPDNRRMRYTADNGGFVA